MSFEQVLKSSNVRRDTSLLAEQKRYIHLVRRDKSPGKKKRISIMKTDLFCFVVALF